MKRQLDCQTGLSQRPRPVFCSSRNFFIHFLSKLNIACRPVCACLNNHFILARAKAPSVTLIYRAPLIRPDFCCWCLLVPLSTFDRNIPTYCHYSMSHNTSTRLFVSLFVSGKESTFLPLQDMWYDGYFAFESLLNPAHFIRRLGEKLRLQKYENSHFFKEDSSFKLTRKQCIG